MIEICFVAIKGNEEKFNPFLFTNADNKITFIVDSGATNHIHDKEENWTLFAR